MSTENSPLPAAESPHPADKALAGVYQALSSSSPLSNLCPHCGGTGFDGDDPCDFCDASGRKHLRHPAAPKQLSRRNASARHLTADELNEWFRELNACLERQRRSAARSASIPRESRRLMRVRAQSSYVARGMRWWNGLSERERLEALRAADTCCAAEAWHWHQEALRRPIAVGYDGRLVKAVEVRS